jgi:hypothetical protein
MTFLPFETIVIETPLTKEDTIINLTKNIEPEKTFRFLNKSDTKAFEGHLRGNEFEIKRIINYRNSFLPIIKGRVETSGQGTRITIDMRLHAVVIVFMLIWFGFVGLFFIASIINSEDGNETILFPLGMLVFGYALTMGGYLFESFRTKEVLTDIIKGRIINNAR